MKAYGKRTHPVRRCGLFLLYAIGVFLFPEAIGYAENEPPNLAIDTGDSLGESENGEIYALVASGEKMTAYASGGTSEVPPPDKGLAPWTKTGNVRYTWYLEGSLEAVSVLNGETTVEPFVFIARDNAYEVNVRVSVQEEYQSSPDENGNVTALYWPEKDDEP